MFRRLKRFVKEALLAFKNVGFFSYYPIMSAFVVTIFPSLIRVKMLFPVPGSVPRGLLLDTLLNFGLYLGLTVYIGGLALAVRAELLRRKQDLLNEWYFAQKQIPCFSGLVKVLNSYIADAELVGGALMLEEAKQLMASLPGIAREYVALGEASISTQSDIKKQMYRGTEDGIELRLTRATELFSSEHARLLENSRDVGNAHVEKELGELTSIYTLDAVVEELEVISKAGEQVDELTPKGADSLSREIEALREKPVVKMLPKAEQA